MVVFNAIGFGIALAAVISVFIIVHLHSNEIDKERQRINGLVRSLLSLNHNQGEIIRALKDTGIIEKVEEVKEDSQ